MLPLQSLLMPFRALSGLAGLSRLCLNNMGIYVCLLGYPRAESR